MHIPWVYIYKILHIENIPLAYKTMIESKQCELGKLLVKADMLQ